MRHDATPDVAQRLALRSEAVAPVGETTSPLEGAKVPSFHLQCGDAVDFLRTIPSSSIDLAITDPPYESLEKHRAVGTTTRLKRSKASSNDWFQIFPNSRFHDLFGEFWRVLKKNTHLYLFCDAETMFVAKPIAEAVGFKFWKPLVWDKKRIGMGYHYRSRCEFILFFEKGKRKLRDLSVPDIIEAPRIWKGYPTEKPADVSRVLIGQSSVAGEVVMDPFMGAGSVGAAALKADRRFLGNDLSSQAVEITKQRLLAAGGTEVTLALLCETSLEHPVPESGIKKNGKNFRQRPRA
ncbi:DNA-methyltransferase [Polyangium sorediatum]|uniref:Methyltransferase n=1 Tax=Polyangium sorediatum TaxID=889274 RepID=A0ABT6NRT1_9BACT|nr:site-specific DNA-methyltransferase [Polyangium sorediatum]MDI1431051.1 site-specific DNA-methyltransferase [Polyangium sorediatum]